MTAKNQLTSLDTIISKQEAKSGRVRITVSLTREAYEVFKKKCGMTPVSRALDRLIRHLFIK